MADIRFNNKNNQKKTLSVFASGELTADNIGDTLFTLPEGAYVTSIASVEADGSGVGEGGVTGIIVGGYYPTGATVIASGITETEKIIVQYIETELANGQYTD